MKHATRIALMGVVLALASIGRAESVAGQVPTAEARAFVGDWNIDVQGEVATRFRINIMDRSGHLGVVVTSADGNERTPTEVTKTGNDLVVKYVTTVQGVGEAPIAVTLRPGGEGLEGMLDLGDGMFTAEVKGTKRQ